VLMGGIKDGVDAAKALALGARAIAVGTSAIIAGGCIACLQCHVGQCVVGIATQDPVHEKRYNIPVEAQNIHRFLECLRWQVASVTNALGYKNVHDLSRDDLVALRQVVDYDAAAIYLVARGTERLEMVSAHGYPEGSESAFDLQIGQGIVGWVAKSGESVIVPDVRNDRRYVAARPATRSEIATPMMFEGRVVGVFNLESNLDDAYHEGHLEMVWARWRRAGDSAGDGMGEMAGWEMAWEMVRGGRWQTAGAGEKVSDLPLNCADNRPR